MPLKSLYNHYYKNHRALVDFSQWVSMKESKTLMNGSGTVVEGTFFFSYEASSYETGRIPHLKESITGEKTFSMCVCVLFRTAICFHWQRHI